MVSLSRVYIGALWICGSFLLIFEDPSTYTWEMISQTKVFYILYALLIIELIILKLKMRKAALTISETNEAETKERFQMFTALVNGISTLV